MPVAKQALLISKVRFFNPKLFQWVPISWLFYTVPFWKVSYPHAWFLRKIAHVPGEICIGTTRRIGGCTGVSFRLCSVAFGCGS